MFPPPGRPQRPRGEGHTAPAPGPGAWPGAGARAAGADPCQQGGRESTRDWQKVHGGGQLCRGKTFDTFAPLGPCLVSADELPDPGALRLRTLLNGHTVQEAATSALIFDVPALIAFLSGSTTLLPGTVILTGTPSVVGMAADTPPWLRPGDTVTVEIEGIVRLTNPVIEEPPPPPGTAGIPDPR